MYLHEAMQSAADAFENKDFDALEAVQRKVANLMMNETEQAGYNAILDLLVELAGEWENEEDE